MYKVIFLLLVIVIFSCSKSSNNPTNNSNPALFQFIPYTSGNYWNYTEIVYNSSGGIDLNSTSPLAVIGDTIINNETWKIILNNNKDNHYFKLRNDGVYEYYLIDYNTFSDELEFKYPAKIGDNYVFCVSKNVYDTITVVSLNDTVKTQAGTFICIKYKLHDEKIYGNADNFRYVCPGIGLIKDELYINNGINSYYRYKIELFDYKVK